MVWQGTQRSSQWENETTRYAVSYCWQTSFIIWTHLSPTVEHTCFAGTSTVNRSPHRHSSRCWLEAPAGSSTEKLAAASGRRRWPICWCCLDRGPGSFDVEDATTLSWSSAAVSEWVSEWDDLSSNQQHENTEGGTRSSIGKWLIWIDFRQYWKLRKCCDPCRL